MRVQLISVLYCFLTQLPKQTTKKGKEPQTLSSGNGQAEFSLVDSLLNLSQSPVSIFNILPSRFLLNFMKSYYCLNSVKDKSYCCLNSVMDYSHTEANG